jgi:hypothetical protein
MLRVFTCAVILSAALHETVSAAPPSATYLYPAGAQHGTTVEVIAGGAFEHWPIAARADDAGIAVNVGTEKGKLTVTVASGVKPGRHWIWLYDGQGASVPLPFIVGTLKEVREKEPNDEIKSAQHIALPATVNGRLEKPGDVDCYAVSLKKGQTMVAAFDGWSTLRSPMDAVLQILSSDGFVLDENNDFHGLDPYIAFQVPKDGAYIVRTFAFPAVPDTSIRFSGGESYVYRLTLTAGGYADYTFPLAVERNEPTKVGIVGWNIPVAASIVAIKPGEVSDHVEVVHPQIANDVRFRVEPHRCAVKSADSADPITLEPPISVSSQLIAPRAVDHFVLKAKKSQTLILHVESREIGLPVTAVIRVTDAAGKELARAEPSGLHNDPELSFTPPADGDYPVTVTDLYADGGPRFAYLLRVTRPEPEFTLSVAADRFAVAAGQSIELPVTVQRSNGFNGQIDLQFDGLPLGVEASVLPGKDPAKIIVRLTASGFSRGAGPFHIIGRAKSNTGRDRAATALLPAPFDGAPAVRIHEPWLTITRPAAK